MPYSEAQSHVQDKTRQDKVQLHLRLLAPRQCRGQILLDTDLVSCAVQYAVLRSKCHFGPLRAAGSITADRSCCGLPVSCSTQQREIGG